MGKPRIDEIKVRALIDVVPDHSFLGEYVDTAEEWAICRHCERYVHDLDRRESFLEAVQDRIYDLEDRYDENPIRYGKLIKALEKVGQTFEGHDCPMSNRELNYFKPYAGGEPEGSEEYRKYGLQDLERMEGLNRGDWCFLGIIAEAVVSYPVNGNGGDRRIERFTSSGLWGIESDAGAEHLEATGREELHNLKRHLGQFNVDLSNFDELAEDAEVEPEM